MSASPSSFTRRRFLRRSAELAGAGTLGVGFYAWRIEPHWVEVVHRRMPIAQLPEAWVGKTLAHISDLHVGPVVDERYLRSALERLMQAKPDLVIVTGDWMTCIGPEQVESAVSVARELQPGRTPVVSILGNHDYGKMVYRRPGPANHQAANGLTDGLRKIGVRMLRNECTEIDGLQIAGMDDLWSGHCQITRTLRLLDPQRAAITLVHNPDTVDRGSGWSNYQGWVLAGHTHGGQCRGPGFRAKVLPVFNKQYDSGEIALSGNRRLYINRGLGYKHRVRFLVRPEITLFRLERQDAPLA